MNKGKDTQTQTRNTAVKDNGSNTPEGFVQDHRGLPMYSAEECENHPVQGYPCGVGVLRGAERPFRCLIMKLTKPCPALVGNTSEDREVKEQPIGSLIYVPGANLDDLDERALHPTDLYEHILTPKRERVKMRNGGKMVAWDRLRSVTAKKRTIVCPELAQAPTFAEVQQKLLTMGQAITHEASFDPNEIEEGGA